MDRYLRAYSLPRSDFFSYIDRQNLDPQLTKRVKTKVVQHALLRVRPRARAGALGGLSPGPG